MEFQCQIDLAPDSPEAHNSLGLVLLSQADGALHEFQAAVKLDPRNYAARDNLGTLYLQKAMWGDAIANSQSLIDLDPSSAEAH